MFEAAIHPAAGLLVQKEFQRICLESVWGGVAIVGVGSVTQQLQGLTP